MNQGRVDKAKWLAWAFMRRPQDFPRYLRLGLQPETSTTTHAVPWISFGAIEALERRLGGEEVVYEYGGGGSTLFFAERCARVVTVENDVEWADTLEKLVADRGLDNVEIIRASADFDDPTTFAASDFACALSGEADIVLVDCYDPLPPYPLRPVLFPIAESKVKPGGVLVIDDSWRYPQIPVRSQAREVQRYFGAGPCRRTATSTDLHCY